MLLLEGRPGTLQRLVFHFARLARLCIPDQESQASSVPIHREPRLKTPGTTPWRLGFRRLPARGRNPKTFFAPPHLLSARKREVEIGLFFVFLGMRESRRKTGSVIPSPYSADQLPFWVIGREESSREFRPHVIAREHQPLACLGTAVGIV